MSRSSRSRSRRRTSLRSGVRGLTSGGKVAMIAAEIKKKDRFSGCGTMVSPLEWGESPRRIEL